jgi:hypothetical protein
MYTGTGAAGGTSTSDGIPGDGVLPGTGDGYTMALLNLSGSSDTGTFTYSGPSLGNFVLGQSYALTVAIGWRLDEPASASYTLELLNNGTPIASTSATTASSQGSFNDLTLNLNDSSYSGSIGLAIVASDNDNDFEQANFDNVRLAETPEPSTYAEILGGCMLLGLIAGNRRRFRA